MGAGASIEDTGDLKKEYEKVKPTLTETQKTTLEETYKKVEGKNEFLIIGKCKKAYAELGIEGADPAFLPKEKKAAAPPPTKAPEPKKVQGLGAMHSLTHAAGGLLNTQHGQTISVVMPYVLQHNRPAIADSFEALGRYLDLEDASVTGVTDWVLELRETCGIPNTLAEIGVDEAHVATLAPMAVEDPSSGSNPTPVTEQAATDLYLSAIRGKL